MALVDIDDPDRLALERWVGPIDDSELAVDGKWDKWITLFGEPELAALQELKTKLGRLVKIAYDVGSGSARSRHDKNIDAYRDLIDELVSHINDVLDDLSLTPAGEDLLASASAGPTDETILVGTTVHNRRRG